MIDLAALLGGIVLVLAVFADFVLATTGSSIRPPLSSLVARAVFGAVRATARARAPGLAHLLVGSLVMTAVAFFWILGIWFGWTLIYLYDPAAILWSSDELPAGPLVVLGHAGQQVSTLGGGATQSEGVAWILAGALASIMGMIVMTLGVSFILRTTETVTHGQTLCALLDAFDPADPEAAATLVPQLAQTVASMGSAPFALYYSNDDPARRVPDRFAALAGRLARDPDAMRRYRPVLARLPGLSAPQDAGPEAFAQAMARWSAGFALSPLDEVDPQAARGLGGQG